MSDLKIVIQKDKPQSDSLPGQKKCKQTGRNVQPQPLSAPPKSTMTIPMSAKRPNHNKWEAVMSKMAETKHRPINVKVVKSKVFTTKVNVIPSHPSSAHRVQEKEEQDLIKIMGSNKAPGGKLTTRVNSKAERNNRLPNLIKETYSSQSSTLSSSSEEQHSHPQRLSRLLVKQSSSSTSCTSSTGTVISSSNCRSPIVPSKNTSVSSTKVNQESNNRKNSSGIPVPHDVVQSLRTELLREQGLNKELRLELHTLRNAAAESRQALELELATAERRLAEARSDWEREREHAWEETHSIRRAHELETQVLHQAYKTELQSLKERYHVEIDLLGVTSQTDLSHRVAAFECRQLEQEKKHEFELEEMKVKQLEELENLESHYKVEIELLQQKIKNKSSSSYNLSSGTKDNSSDLLHKEITSLTVVVELRNNEIKDLRQEVMSQRLELERRQGVDDQNHLLIQKVEDLAAQVQKTRDDKKKLIVENQTMQSSIHEALTAKEKLCMELDFLRYRIEETNPDGGTTSTLDMLT